MEPKNEDQRKFVAPLVAALQAWHEEGYSWKDMERETGVHSSNLARIAKGTQLPGIDTWDKITTGAQSFKVPPPIPPATFKEFASLSPGVNEVLTMAIEVLNNSNFGPALEATVKSMHQALNAAPGRSTEESSGRDFEPVGSRRKSGKSAA